MKEEFKKLVKCANWVVLTENGTAYWKKNLKEVSALEEILNEENVSYVVLSKIDVHVKKAQA